MFKFDIRIKGTVKQCEKTKPETIDPQISTVVEQPADPPTTPPPEARIGFR